ncbi:zinc finger protein-domain-containing protein [Diplogelasinospora grovesii]|uniref:Zinc finger protein-domain-containing protein n=1 Tax=Diplogelasinospora grovesii TaxID=303347 RepID=A0AAN6N0D0_9PEZI|nr:zinc finger protein-domain-containing protein [Diplogelasinospora grovesii]
MDQYQSLKNAAEGIVNLPTAALISQRIQPLPARTRHLLIDKYCAPRIRQSALGDPANNDCLVRVYLGSMVGRANQMFFSLRNFKLHLNQMQQIQMEVEPIARGIGEAMAVMPWAAKTDARDVEFVLGTSSDFRPMGRFDADELTNLDPGTYTGPMSRVHQDFFGRKTELWILDFNQVRKIKMDKEGVEQAVQAATINDPYLPRPLGDSEVERRAWNTFVTSYLETSERVIRKEGMEDEVMQLPVMFLEGLIDVQRKKQEMTKQRE